MPRTARRKSASGIYHVILRGNNKQRIFEDDEDYRKFMQILNLHKKQCGFILYAWCLMPNHIHLLMKEGNESISAVFRKINPIFVYWYNAKYDRVGHLFQDRFRSEVVEDESYFLTVLRYIHLNPVKAGLCRNPAEWLYSSYAYYFENAEHSGNDFLFNMIERSELERFHKEKNDDICLDFDHPAVRRITDEQAEKIAKDAVECDRIGSLQSMPEELRERAIRNILKAGGSIRQINRLTGISVGVIEKIKGRKE